MRFSRKVRYILGFDLPTNLTPKPNKVIYTKPVRVNGILISSVKQCMN